MAWYPAGETSYIKELTTYGSDSSNVVITLESGANCYLTNTDGDIKKVYDLLLMIKAFSKKGVFYCYDSIEDISGYPSHRLHRLTAR